MGQVDVRLTLEAFDAGAELSAFAAGRTLDGAVASFIGLARGERDGARITALELDHYPGFTERLLHEIAQAAVDRFAVSAVLVLHRAGRIAPGETIVLAAAAAAHRRPALAAVDYLMDRLKTDAAFWKREEGLGEARWIEPTAADLAARRRWD